jgi:hypothetical protein
MSVNDLLHLLNSLRGAVWHLVLREIQRHPWAVAVALYGMARAFGVMIQSGQRGVLFRFGRAVKELEPGFHWLVPVVHGVKTTPVRSVTIELPGQKVMTADGLVYDVSVNIVYRVQSAIKALTLVDHLDAGCRAAIPIIVTEVLRTRAQAQLVDRRALDRELSERMHLWVARWGLVIEQAGYTTIAPSKCVLHTTQLRSRTMERSRALRALLGGALAPESALVLIGSERHPVGKTTRRYHRAHKRTGRATGARSRRRKTASRVAVDPPATEEKPVEPPAPGRAPPVRVVRRAFSRSPRRLSC